MKNMGLIGSCTSEKDEMNAGGNINCIAKYRVVKTFWIRIKDAKYIKPIVKLDFTS
jgi:hypothetical protein